MNFNSNIHSLNYSPDAPQTNSQNQSFEMKRAKYGYLMFLALQRGDDDAFNADAITTISLERFTELRNVLFRDPAMTKDVSFQEYIKSTEQTEIAKPQQLLATDYIRELPNPEFEKLAESILAKSILDDPETLEKFMKQEMSDIMGVSAKRF